MSIILDLIVVAIIVLMIILSAKRGFVRTLVEVVGFIAAVMISISLGGAIAGVSYDKAVGPKIVEVVVDNGANSSQELIDKTWDALPEFIADNAEKLGISKEAISQKINENTGDDVAVAVEQALETTVRPAFVKMFGMLCSVLLFIIFTFIVKILARMLNGLFSFSLVGSINRALGGIIGIAKGVIFALVFCMVIGFIASITGGFLIFTPEAIGGSKLFSLLLSFTPFSF